MGCGDRSLRIGLVSFWDSAPVEPRSFWYPQYVSRVVAVALFPHSNTTGVLVGMGSQSPISAPLNVMGLGSPVCDSLLCGGRGSNAHSWFHVHLCASKPISGFALLWVGMPPRGSVHRSTVGHDALLCFGRIFDWSIDSAKDSRWHRLCTR
jgi:hypothetical protein